MPAFRIPFTYAALSKLPTPREGKRAYYYDSKCRGLVLDVTAKGAKSFRLYRKVAGKPERILIGRFPDMPIEQARGKAHELNAAIASGANPASRARRVRGEMTLGEMFDLYMERHAKLEKRSWKSDQWLFGKYLSDWGDRKLSGISRDDVERRKSAIGKTHGKYSANRTLSLLSALYGKADAWGWEGHTPTKGVKKFSEKKRDRFVEPDEMPAFLDALKNELDTDARDAILLMLVTGARKMNVLSMRWPDVHFARAVWTIPLPKSGDPFRCVLVPFAVELLERRRKSAGKSEYVFPGRHGRGHRTEVSSAWNRIRKASKLRDVRLHDLRRTLGSWQAAAGVSLPIIGKGLDHRDVSTTAIYARLSLDPVRAAITNATSMMLASGIEKQSKGINGAE